MSEYRNFHRSSGQCPFLDQVRDHLAFLPKSTKICVAVSGGKDSVCLLHSLFLLQEQGPRFAYLSVLHVNHQIREREAQRDADFVERLAARYNLPFNRHTLFWERGEKKSQLAARQKREAVYATILQNHDYIALGHHLNDQVETFLMRLFRGSGLSGLAGMRSPQGKKIRPFLSFSASQIHKQMEKWQLQYLEDSSNREIKYERNWIRNELLPLIESRRPKAGEKIAHIALEIQRVFQERIDELIGIETVAGKIFSQNDLLLATDYTLVKSFGLARQHVAMVRRVLQKGQGKLELPGQVLWCSQGWIFVPKQPWPKIQSQNRSWQSVLGSWKISDAKFLLKSASPGDGFRVKKKLINRKIPAFLRSQIPVLIGEKKEPLLPHSFSRNEKWQIAKVKVEFTPSKLAQELFKSDF